MKKIKGDIFNTDSGILIMLIRTQLNEVIDAVNELQERVEENSLDIAEHERIIGDMGGFEPAKKEDKPSFKERLSDLVAASQYRNDELIDAIIALAEKHYGGK